MPIVPRQCFIMKTTFASDRDEIDCYLDSVEHLPPAPTLLARLISLFRQPDRDVDEVVSLMKADPSLTAELLHRCNSSYYGYEEPVLDVADAVFRLGFYEVYRMSVALFGLNAISNKGIANGVQVEQLWRHSAITAIAAGLIAREMNESEGIAFTAGLLHDVGKIVLGSSDPKKYSGLLKEHGQHGAALNKAEELSFGFEHGKLGARLLSRWDVPEQVSIPVLGHHQIAWTGPFERLSAIINLANLMAHRIETKEPDNLPEMVHAITLLGLKQEDVPELEQQIRAEVKRSLSFFVAGA